MKCHMKSRLNASYNRAKDISELRGNQLPLPHHVPETLIDADLLGRQRARLPLGYILLDCNPHDHGAVGMSRASVCLLPHLGNTPFRN